MLGLPKKHAIVVSEIAVSFEETWFASKTNLSESVQKYDIRTDFLLHGTVFE